MNANAGCEAVCEAAMYFSRVYVRMYHGAKTYICMLFIECALLLSRIIIMCLISRCDVGTLPSLGMVFAESRIKVLVPAGVRLRIVQVHVDFLGILLKVGDVMGCMSPLEDSVGSLRLLLTLPEKLMSKTDSQLICEHISAGRFR
jgi:hypothetical protein